jgi:hypothetical protein
MMTGEDREKWVRAMRDEMDSLKALNVHEEMSEEEVFKQYRSKGIPTKIIPGKLVATKKPLFDEKGGWKPKARICGCGNFERGSKGKDIANRAEVPATFEMRILLALSQLHGYDIGGLDIKTAFLHAPLDDDVDGVYLGEAPSDSSTSWSHSRRSALETKQGAVWIKVWTKEVGRPPR